MKVTVLFFASAREAIGMSETTITISSGASIEVLIASSEFEPLTALLSSMRFALNEEFSRRDAVLNDGDVVAVLPPVSGG
ncbi:MAG: molybdopterin converting factor subunit 1 [Elusimicrobia bacterium]|nr:MAG: molybdopterin converting factor subunit 1 [Elusimicrobiota bacterium]